jgi:MGT family glycosyltransferase
MKATLKGKKILFATLPAPGHFNPLTGLAYHLQEAGCDVRWYTTELFAPKLTRMGIPHYPFLQALDVNSDKLDELFPARITMRDPLEKINFDMINGFANRAPEYLADIEAIYQEFAFDLMVADSLFPAIPFVKAALHVPVVAIGVVPLAEDSVDLAPYGMGRQPPQAEAEAAEYAQLREMTTKVLFKPSVDAFVAVLENHGIDLEPSSPINVLIKTADLYLQIGTPSFEYPRSDLGSNIRFIGALLPYEAFTPATWQDERLAHYQRVVLVTQGTVEKDTKKLLEPTLEAFRNTDTLVIATTGGRGAQELRAKYGADNVIIEDFIPFSEVMPRASVFVTNGGYGGVLLSIQHRLPLVTAGVHEGKNEICARVDYFHLGLDLHTETPTADAIRAGVQQVLASAEYKANIARLADEFESYEPYALAASYISEVLEKPTPAPLPQAGPNPRS